MNTQTQSNVIEAINVLLKTLSIEQKITIINELSLEISSKRPNYKKEIINARKSQEGYLFKGNDFEDISKQILNEEKVDFEKLKKSTYCGCSI
ncbi:MAG: hypothetical protein JEY97_11285 [Bacteroidales bacterium]|nr:hypothetical protein [Bacteroidales bacterium]